MACNYCFSTGTIFQINSEFLKKGTIIQTRKPSSCLFGLNTPPTTVPRSGIELTTSRLQLQRGLDGLDQTCAVSEITNKLMIHRGNMFNCCKHLFFKDFNLFTTDYQHTTIIPQPDISLKCCLFILYNI